MARPLRWYLPDVIYEVTTRTIQERYLLRPGNVERDLILGVLGRGLVLYAHIMLHAFVYLSNHMHMLLSASDPTQIAPFLGYVNGNVARLVGQRNGWRGPFWSRRAQVIPVLDDESAEGRMRYILSHGVKEGLVARPEEWPGASSTPALLGEPLQGVWRSTSKGRSDAKSGRACVEETYDISLAPLPSWTRMDPAARIARVRAIVDDIVREHGECRSEPALGIPSVQARDPHARPGDPSRSRAPSCHAASPELRRAYRASYAEFCSRHRSASLVLENDRQRYQGGFPQGSFAGVRTLVCGTSCVGPSLEVHIDRVSRQGVTPMTEPPTTSTNLMTPPSPSSQQPDETATEPAPSITLSQEALRAAPPRRARRRLRARSPAESRAEVGDAPPPRPRPKPPPVRDRDRASSA